MRTLVAAGLIALVVASTAVATLVLTSSQTTSTVLGYVPADSVAYGELRLDLPGDQRQNVAEFLSKFPGFADQAALDTKLDEVLDRLVSEGTDGKQTFTKDVKPWFDGQLGFAIGAIPSGAAADPEALAKDAHALMLLSVKDAALARTWFNDTLGANGVTGTTETYNGTELTVFEAAKLPTQAAFAIVDGKVAIAGDVASVKAAIDTKGSSAVTKSEAVVAAQTSMPGDDLGFMFVNVKSIMDASCGGRRGAAVGVACRQGAPRAHPRVGRRPRARRGRRAEARRGHAPRGRTTRTGREPDERRRRVRAAVDDRAGRGQRRRRDPQRVDDPAPQRAGARGRLHADRPGSRDARRPRQAPRLAG